MKITIYELLGLIKDGKAPKKIKVTGRIYEYDENYDFYYTKSNKANYNVSLGGMEDEINLIANAFNENVEILEPIEDEFIDIEEIIYPDLNKNFDFEMKHKDIEKTYDAINDLIKNQKKIIDKLKDSE